MRSASLYVLLEEGRREATGRWATPELWSLTREHRLPRRTLRELSGPSEGDMDFVQPQTLLEQSLSCRLAPAEAPLIPAQKKHSYLLTHLITYLLTFLLAPWSTVLLEKLTGFQLVKKFLVFNGTRRFITALTSVRHLSLS